MARKLDHFTWEDYRRWPSDERWELVDGEAYAMSPSPGSRHQRVVMNLVIAFGTFFKGKRCTPFVSPMDVKLSETDVVQPDLLVVCDPAQIKPTHIEGAPTLVVEILSPTSELHDRARKLRLYAEHGVAEYWIVGPYPSFVEVLVLDGDGFRVKQVYAREQTLLSPTFPGLEVELANVFDFPIDPSERIDEVREGTPYAARPSA